MVKHTLCIATVTLASKTPLCSPFLSLHTSCFPSALLKLVTHSVLGRVALFPEAFYSQSLSNYWMSGNRCLSPPLHVYFQQNILIMQRGKTHTFQTWLLKMEVTEIARVALSKVLLTCGSRCGSKRARNHFSKTWRRISTWFPAVSERVLSILSHMQTDQQGDVRPKQSSALTFLPALSGAGTV